MYKRPQLLSFIANHTTMPVPKSKIRACDITTMVAAYTGPIRNPDEAARRFFFSRICGNGEAPLDVPAFFSDTMAHATPKAQTIISKVPGALPAWLRFHLVLNPNGWLRVFQIVKPSYYAVERVEIEQLFRDLGLAPPPAADRGHCKILASALYDKYAATASTPAEFERFSTVLGYYLAKQHQRCSHQLHIAEAGSVPSLSFALCRSLCRSLCRCPFTD